MEGINLQNSSLVNPGGVVGAEWDIEEEGSCFGSAIEEGKGRGGLGEGFIGSL